MSSGKVVEPLSGSGRLISDEYDNSTKPCAVQAILESLMSLRSAWARYQTVRRQKENISMLPYFLTYSILLSTSRRLVPLSPERETFCMLPLISFCILTLCKRYPGQY